jgi:crossover junction endodeoxyribonuclease RuvC
VIILGIDPGTATTGFGLISYTTPSFDVMEWGLIETKKEIEHPVRLSMIYSQMTDLLQRSHPDLLVIEKVFFSTNVKTAISVGQAQGVILLSAAQASVPVVEYSPGTIKKMISGNGRADKKMMQTHVRKHLGNKVRSEAHKRTHFDNAADALAIALCHIFMLAS